MRVFVFIFVVVVATFYTYAQKNSYYFDLTGKPINITIPPYVRYEYPEPGFSEGLCAAKGGGSKVVYIDGRGKVVIDNDYYDGGPFSEGLAYVCDSQGKYGFIDKKGNVVIPLIYDDALSFSCGLASVYSKKEELWGFINRNGELVINYFYDKVYPFSEGYAFVYKRGAHPPGAFIDTKGNNILEFDHGVPFFLSTYTLKEGLFGIRDFEKYEGNDGYGNMLWQGVCKVEESVQEEYYFSNGLAIAEQYIGKKKLFGFINVFGEFVIKPRFFKVCPFNEGFAWARMYSEKKKKNISVIINTLGDIVIEDINIPETARGVVVKEGVIVWY